MKSVKAIAVTSNLKSGAGEADGYGDRAEASHAGRTGAACVTAWLRSRATCAVWMLLQVAGPVVVQAQFRYTTNNGAITLTGYSGSGGVVTIPGTIDGFPVTALGSNAFYSATNLTAVSIPEGVTSIGEGAFSGCTSLTNATTPTSLTSLGASAFCNCYYLARITIPNGVTNIGASAFHGCLSLTSVTLPDSVTSLGDATFSCCTRLASVTLPTTLTNLPDSVFLLCCRLANLTIPDRVTRIGNSAFYFCLALTNVIVPAEVAWIGNRAFASCSNMKTITLPDSLTDLGDEVFSSCGGLSSITLPSGVTNIGQRTFCDCAHLTSLQVDPRNSCYSSLDGVLFNKSQTVLITCVWAKTGRYTVPTGVTRFADQAFTSLILWSVTIPNSVTNLGSETFLNSTSVASVYFEGNAPAHGSAVFCAPSKATVYYLAGTTGWGSTFAGRPTLLWNPQAQTGGGSLGVRTNQFGFNITGASNLLLVVEACTNLVHPSWAPVGTNTLTGGLSYFSDPRWTNSPARFYRLRVP